MDRSALPANGDIGEDTATTFGEVSDQIDSPNIVELIHAYHAHVYRYAYRLVGNEGDAEDLTQQGFLVAQQKLAQLRDPTKARGWLFAIVRNCFLKQFRKSSPTPASSFEIDVNELPHYVPREETIDSELLQAAVSQLPTEFKAVVLMFYFEERSYKEIAEQLELPIGTVMSRLSRAKGRLRGILLAADPDIACDKNGKVQTDSQ